jgi:hypothetical protein
MEKATRRITLTIAGLVLASFCPAAAHAQADTAPDTYKSTTEAATPAPPPETKVEFQGKFSLPYKARCNGHDLAPGEYTLAVKTIGKNRMVTIQREGNEIVLTVSKVATDSASGQTAVLLRHGPGPWARTIEGVYVDGLKLMLYLDESGHTDPLSKIFAGVKRVPVS